MIYFICSTPNLENNVIWNTLEFQQTVFVFFKCCTGSWDHSPALVTSLIYPCSLVWRRVPSCVSGTRIWLEFCSPHYQTNIFYNSMQQVVNNKEGNILDTYFLFAKYTPFSIDLCDNFQHCFAFHIKRKSKIQNDNGAVTLITLHSLLRFL